MDEHDHTTSGEITRLLQQAPDSGQDLTDRLMPLVYGELKLMARSKMARERAGQTLTPTALVHDAYLRLISNQSLSWQSRRHFFAAASEAMRRILVESARRKATEKHGGKYRHVCLVDPEDSSQTNHQQIIDIDHALTRLEGIDQGLAEVVSLRYFAGLTIEQTAELMNHSVRTVNRRWLSARAWMMRELSPG